MQSYLDRQDQTFESENGWQHDHEHQSLDGSEGGIVAVDRTEGSISSPSVITQINGDNGLLQDADDMQTVSFASLLTIFRLLEVAILTHSPIGLFGVNLKC